MRLPWTTAALAGLCLAAACVPGSSEALQYDRGLVMDGEVWRLLTGQLVHWSARMALADLGVLLVLGAWLEARGERLILTLGLGAILTALAVHALSPDLAVYRGSSGLASALFVRTAVRVARSTGRGPRGLALAAVVLFLAKAAWETVTGEALFAGPLAPGVRVVPLVHLLGGLAGVAGWRAAISCSRHESARVFRRHRHLPVRPAPEREAGPGHERSGRRLRGWPQPDLVPAQRIRGLRGGREPEGGGACPPPGRLPGA